MHWPHNAKYDWQMCEVLTTNCQQSKPLTSWVSTGLAEMFFTFPEKKKLDTEQA